MPPEVRAAPINWRPLGELFVEAGLVSREDLEEALAEQEATSQRLGEILVSRRLVSPPELTGALLDQLSRELERERPNGLGVLPRATKHADETSETRRDPQTRPAPAVESQAAAVHPAVPAETPPAPAVESQAAAVHPAVPAETPPAPAPAADALAPDAAEGEDPRLLLRQVDELRGRLVTEFATREAELVRRLHGLEHRLETLEGALAEERSTHHSTLEELEREQTAHRRTLAELDRGRSEAGQQAAELRSSVGRLRNELANVEAGMAWFEFWSTGAAPDAPPDGSAR